MSISCCRPTKVESGPPGSDDPAPRWQAGSARPPVVGAFDGQLAPAHLGHGDVVNQPGGGFAEHDTAGRCHDSIRWAIRPAHRSRCNRVGGSDLTGGDLTRVQADS